jgi:hypothetical protein
VRSDPGADSRTSISIEDIADAILELGSVIARLACVRIDAGGSASEAVPVQKFRKDMGSSPKRDELACSPSSSPAMLVSVEVLLVSTLPRGLRLILLSVEVRVVARLAVSDE